MKNLFLTFTIVGSIFIYSCKDAGSKSSGTQSTLTFNQLVDSVDNTGDSIVGKQFIFNATSWGTSKTTTGDTYLNLGGEKLSGMQQPRVVCNLGATVSADLMNKIKQDSQLKVTGTIESPNDYGSIKLKNVTVE